MSSSTLRQITALPALRQLLLAEQNHQPLPIYHAGGTDTIIFDGSPHEHTHQQLYRFFGHRVSDGAIAVLEIWDGQEAAIEFFPTGTDQLHAS